MSLSLRRICAFSGFLSPLIAYSLIYLAIIHAPWFSWLTNALSDLGAVPISGQYFNTGLIISGLLESIFCVGLFFSVKMIINYVGVFLLLLNSFSLIGIGLFPETAGRIHFYFSVAFFLLLFLSLLFLGFFYFRVVHSIGLGVLGLFCSISSLIIWLIPWNVMGVYGVAIPELLSSFFGSVWVMSASIAILKMNF